MWYVFILERGMNVHIIDDTSQSSAEYDANSRRVIHVLLDMSGSILDHSKHIISMEKRIAHCHADRIGYKNRSSLPTCQSKSTVASFRTWRGSICDDRRGLTHCKNRPFSLLSQHFLCLVTRMHYFCDSLIACARSSSG